jgi:hypothetical protein
MALFTLTVNNLAPALDKKAQEVQVIARALNLAEASVRGAGGQQTSGNINGDGGVLLGSWTYTPRRLRERRAAITLLLPLLAG